MFYIWLVRVQTINAYGVINKPYLFLVAFEDLQIIQVPFSLDLHTEHYANVADLTKVINRL